MSQQDAHAIGSKLFFNQIVDDNEDVEVSANFERTINTDHMGELLLQPHEFPFLNKYSDPSTKIDELILAANHSRVRKYDFMKGFVSTHQRQGVFDPLFFGDRIGEAIAIVKIPHGADIFEMRDQADYLQALHAAFSSPVKYAAGPTLSTMGDYFDSGDVALHGGGWSSQLGVHGDSVGLYSRNLARTTEWYLLAASGTPQVGYELWKQLMEEDADLKRKGDRLKIISVANNDKYKYAKRLGERNIQRLLHKAACALEIQDRLDVQSDTESWDGDYDGNGYRVDDELLVTPDRMIGSYVFNECRKTSRPFIRFYSATTKIDPKNTQFPLMVSPLEGAQLLDLKFPGTTSHRNIDRSVIVPLNTGRLFPTEYLQGEGMDGQYSEDETQLIWKSHRTAYVPEDIQKKNIQQASFMQNVYRPFDEDFKAAIESVGVKVNSEWGTLNPVAVVTGKRNE